MISTIQLNDDEKRCAYFFDLERRLTAQKKNLLSRLPLRIREYIDKHSYFAGGCIYSLYNGSAPKDYDLFLDSEEAVEMLNAAKVESVDFVSEYALSMGPYQIVTRFTGAPEDVIGEFDFKHNMFYFKDGKIHNVAPWKYLNSKKLIFNEERARDICGAIMRVPKFVARGMTISKYEMAKMLDLLDKGQFDSRERAIVKKFRNPRSRSKSTY